MTRPVRLSIFYGYSIALIAGWCRVSRATARRWKRLGEAPQTAQALFTLYRDGKVLGDDWRGWKVVGGALVDPAGDRLTQGQLRAYVVIVQLAAESNRGDPARLDRFYELLAQAS